MHEPIGEHRTRVPSVSQVRTQSKRADRRVKQHWADKSAVIIGGSAGLGLELARCLSEMAASRILLVGRDQDRLQKSRTELQSISAKTHVSICAADAQTTQGTQAIADQLSSNGQVSINLLINAVGQSDRGLALQLTTERLDELLRANIHAPLMATQTIAPFMSTGSVIVNIGSLSSLFAPRYLGGYSIAKHGLRALSQQLRLELAQRGIHVMLACPGPIARQDAGSRYSQLAGAGDIPPEALQGGGGARLKGLDARRLATDILNAAGARKLEIIRPRKARLLLWLITLWPALGERVLSSQTR